MNSDAVSQFMALYQSDPDLQEKFAQAEAAYPGSLDIPGMKSKIPMLRMTTPFSFCWIAAGRTMPQRNSAKHKKRRKTG